MGEETETTDYEALEAQEKAEKQEQQQASQQFFENAFQFQEQLINPKVSETFEFLNKDAVLGNIDKVGLLWAVDKLNFAVQLNAIVSPSFFNQAEKTTAAALALLNIVLFCLLAYCRN